MTFISKFYNLEHYLCYTQLFIFKHYKTQDTNCSEIVDFKNRLNLIFHCTNCSQNIHRKSEVRLNQITLCVTHKLS